MKPIDLTPIGAVRHLPEGYAIQLEPRFAPALEGLEGFGHLQVLWWADGCDSQEARTLLAVAQPYRKGPERLGVFATRSPARPNPIGLSSCGLLRVDRERSLLLLDWIDAQDGSPVLDLKPYTPSADRVDRPEVPGWCAHWPASLEASATFDWGSEFTFSE